jgi:hypothetical protein
MAIYVYHDGSLETIIWCEKVLFSKNTKILTVEKVAQIKNVDCVRVEDKIKIEEVKKSKEFLYYI